MRFPNRRLPCTNSDADGKLRVTTAFRVSIGYVTAKRWSAPDPIDQCQYNEHWCDVQGPGRLFLPAPYPVRALASVL